MATLTTCPVCRIRLAEAATHCHRCGLRVAALPRRGSAPARDLSQDGPRPTPPSAVDAVRRGLVVGAALAAVCLLAGLLTHAFGGPGRDVAGDAALVVSGGCVLGAVLGGGVHIQRWAEYDELRRRAGAGLGAARTMMLVAALPPFVAVLAVALR